MGNYVDFEGTLKRFCAAIADGNLDEVRKEYINLIFETSNLFGLTVNYTAIFESCKMLIDFGGKEFKKGTKLYRVRRYNQNTDFSAAEEWAPPPEQKQNRANDNGEKALYLSSKEALCLLEAHIGYGEMYAIGEYEFSRDIFLGGFLEVPEKTFPNDVEQKKLWILLAALNACFTAPSRSEKNKVLFDFLDREIGEINIDDLNLQKLSEYKDALPFLFATLNKRNEYYNITNKLCETIKTISPEGMIYPSCYVPTWPFVGSCYNVVLYSEGLQYIQFKRFEIKRNEHKNFNPATVVSCFIKSGGEL